MQTRARHKAVVCVLPPKNEFVIMEIRTPLVYHTRHSMKMTVCPPYASDVARFCMLHGDYRTLLRELGSNGTADHFFYYARGSPSNRLGLFQGGHASLRLYDSKVILVEYQIHASEMLAMFEEVVAQ